MHAAKCWMIDNQLGRRNLSEGNIRYLRGERYKLEKAQGQRTDLTSPQIEEKSTTAKKLATQYKVSKATIERDAAYAADINAIAAAADTQGSRIIMEIEGKLGRRGQTSYPPSRNDYAASSCVSLALEVNARSRIPRHRWNTASSMRASSFSKPRQEARSSTKASSESAAA
jgi:hypothetical protein